MITKEQRIARRGWIGASDVPAVLGLTEHPTAYEVWASKCLPFEEQESFTRDRQERIEVGNWLEPLLVNWAAKEAGIGALTTPDTQFTECRTIGANLDAATPDLRIAIEAKSSGLADDWGEPGTDEMPARVLAQTAAQFACCSDLELIYVPVLIGRYGLRRSLYRVSRNERLVAIVLERMRDFKKRFIDANVPPDAVAADLEFLKRARREPSKVTEGTVEDEMLVDELCLLDDDLKLMEEKHGEVKAKVISRFGTGDGLRLPSGKLITYMQTSRTSVDSKLLQEKYPDIADECSRVSTFPRLDLKKPRKKKGEA